MFLVPRFLDLYAYQKALIGTDANGKDSHGVSHKSSQGIANHGRIVQDNLHAHGHAHPVCTGQCIIDALIGKDDTTFRVLIKDVCNQIGEEIRAINHARTQIHDALMRPLNPRVPKAPHEPITVSGLKDHFMTTANTAMRRFRESRTTFSDFAFGGKTSLEDTMTEATVRDEEDASLKSEAEMTYNEKLLSRGRTFFEFMLSAGVHPFSKSEGVSNSDLVHGINALTAYRRPGDHPLTHTTEVYLMHALDKNGDEHLSCQEFLNFLMETEDDEDGDDDDDSDDDNNLSIGHVISVTNHDDDENNNDHGDILAAKHATGLPSEAVCRRNEKRKRRSTLAQFKHNDKRELKSHIYESKQEIERLMMKLRAVSQLCVSKAQAMTDAGLETVEELEKERSLYAEFASDRSESRENGKRNREMTLRSRSAST
jgi:hypothetical protein